MSASLRRHLVVASVALLLGAGSAHAETFLTPFAGAAFAGVTERTRFTYGGALGFRGGVVAFEAEFSTTPDFFGSSDQSGVFTKNDVVTLMGSFLLTFPAGPVRVYGAAGAGLFKTRLEDPDRLLDVDSNDFGINVGAGLIGYLSKHAGLRADVRYFRDLEDNRPDGVIDLDLGHVDYWRVVGGIVFKF